MNSSASVAKKTADNNYVLYPLKWFSLSQVTLAVSILHVSIFLDNYAYLNGSNNK